MAPLPKSSRGLNNNKNRKGLSLSAIVSHFLVLLCGIYIGVTMGVLTCPEDDLSMREKEHQPLEQFSKQDTPTSKQEFPKSINKLVMDYATVPRENFNAQMEIGTPMDDTKDGSEEVLVLYTDPKTLPFKKGKGKKQDTGEKHGLDTATALENCHTVKVILQEPAGKKRQCIAIVPQWESYHVHKFMRMPEKITSTTQVGTEYPLRYVGRSMMDNGRVSSVPTLKKHINPSNDALVKYLQHLDTSLDALKPLLEQAVAKHQTADDTSAVMKKSKVMVVMVCNKGQAHLFHNFVCNARAKGLDLSRIIMFATDQYTVKLATDLGIPVFYDETIFGTMPEQAAYRYGDKIFSMMMMAKVYCVHLVMSLGYDVLFQDVDVVWQKNPLEYLESEESKEWDMIFQDDGSRQVRYQPYSPNTGKSTNKLICVK